MNEHRTPNEKQLVMLGLLAEEPIHAYGLEEKIRSRYMTEWTEIGLSSIYRVLSQLEERALIDSHLEHEGQGATRKVYTINASGRDVLAAAVLDHLGKVRPVKNPFQVGLAFLAFAPRDQVVDQLHRRAGELDRWVQELSVARGAPCQGSPLSKRLVLEHALRHLRTEREFLTDVMGWVDQEVPS